MKFNEVKEPFRILYTDTAKYVVIAACRGGGKTVAVTQYAIHRMLHNENYKVIFFSSSLQKANETTYPIMREYIQYFEEEKICEVNHNKSERKYELIFGADDVREFSLGTYENPDKRRGSHPDMIILDEASTMDYHMFDMIIDPMLNHLGFGGKVVIIGTPNGHDKFWELLKRGESEEEYWKDWSSYVFKASSSGLLDKEFIELKQAQLPPEVFEQEYECNFDVSVGSGYAYSKILFKMGEKRINPDVTYDAAKPVYTAWDIGHSDNTSVWFFQTRGDEVRLIDFYEGSGEHISSHAAEVADRGYVIKTSLLPHDARNKNATTLSTVEQVLSEFGLRPVVLERTNSVWNGIQGVNGMLKSAYINSEKCAKGLEHLKNYKTKIDPKTNVNMYVPIHDKHSDAADALRYVWEGKKYWDQGAQEIKIENTYGDGSPWNYGNRREIPKFGM